MEARIVKMSKKGQVVIPAGIRRRAGLGEADQFLVFGKGDTVVFKKIDEPVLERQFEEIAGPLRERVEEVGMSREDVEEVVHAYREEKREEEGRSRH